MTWFFMRFKSQIISAIGGAAVAAYVAYGFLTWHYERKISNLRVESEKSIEATKAAERKACDKNTQITKETDNALQERLSDTDARLSDALERLRLAGQRGNCVPIAGAASGHDEATGHDMPFMRGGVVAEHLLERAATADRQAAQLIACQKFIMDTWAAQKR